MFQFWLQHIGLFDSNFSQTVSFTKKIWFHEKNLATLISYFRPIIEEDPIPGGWQKVTKRHYRALLFAANLIMFQQKIIAWNKYWYKMRDYVGLEIPFMNYVAKWKYFQNSNWNKIRLFLTIGSSGLYKIHIYKR